MAQPYLRGNRWYLKYKDASGRWHDRVCDARTKGRAVELLREILGERCADGYKMERYTDGANSGFQFALVKTG